MRHHSAPKIRPLAVSLARFSTIAAVAAALHLSCSAQARAQTATWDNDALTFNWNDATNWASNALPLTTDQVIFGTAGSAGGIFLQTDQTVASLQFTLDGFILGADVTALALTNTSGNVGVATGATATINALLAGANGLTKSGDGTFAVRGINTYSGLNSITAGTLDFTDDNQLGDVANGITITNGATLLYNGFANWDPAPTRVITIGASGGVLGHATALQGIRINDAGQLTGSGLLTKTGPGVLQATVANTGFTGNIVLSEGVLEVSHSQGFGTGAGQTISVNAGGEVVASSNGGAYVSVPHAIALAASGARMSFDNGNAGNFGGPISASGDFTVSLQDFYQFTGRSGTITGAISGAGRMTVEALANAQSLRLSANNTAWTGGLSISSNAQVRAVKGATTNALGSGAVVLNGGTLGITPEITAAGVNGGFGGRYYNAGGVNVGNLVATLDFGTLNPVATRSDGTINTPNNAAGYFPGVTGLNATNVSALWTGILNITTPGAYSLQTSSDDGSQLFVDGQLVVANDGPHGIVTVTGATSLSAGFHTIVIKYTQGTGGAGMITNYQGPDTGNVMVNLGSVANTVSNAGFGSFGATTMSNPIIVQTDSTIDLSGTSVTSSGTINFGSFAGLTVSGLTGYETFTQTGGVLLDSGNTIATGNAGSGADVVISGNITQLSPSSSLTKSGNRTLTLTGTNSFDGGITINAGTLVGNTVSLNNNSISNFGTLVFNQTANGVYSGDISGSGTVRKIGPGTLFLPGFSGNNGVFTVANGVLNGTGSYAGVVEVNGAAAIAGASGSTFLIGGLTLNGGSNANFALGAPSLVPFIDAAGQLLPRGANLNLTNIGALAAGTYRLIDYAGTPLTATQFGGLSVGTTPGGFFFGLLNNTANSSVDLSVETPAAVRTWTGAVSGTWNAGGAANWTGGTFNQGEQAIFPAGAPNRTISGPAITAQSVTVNTSGGDYSIANNLGGTMAGGLTKNGAGVLTLSGANSFTSKVTLNAGTLAVSATSAASSLGSGIVELNGGILSLTPNATATAGVNGAYFAGAAGTTSQRDYSVAPVATRIESSMNNTFTAAAPPAAGVGTVNAANLDNFGGLFTGKYFVATAGPQTFALSSDDSTRLFIDGVPVVINEGGQGGAFMFTNTVNLSAGYHDIRVQYNQGAGGSNFRLYTPNGVSLNGLSTTDDVLLGNTLKVSATSTLDLAGNNFAVTGFGLLQQTPGTTLNVAGTAGKQLRFNSTVAFGTGTMTINATPDVTLGVVSAPGVTLLKQGAGRLVLDNTSATANDFTGSTIEVQGGRLVAVGSTAVGSTNPLGTAAITLNGGSLFLDSKFNGGTFANTVNLTGSGTIESLPSVVTTILGSGANSLNLNANNLTIDTFAGGTGLTQAGVGLSIGNAAGSTLSIASPLTGNGTITKVSTMLNTANIIQTSRNRGIVAFNSNSPSFSGNIVINAGTVTAQGIAAAAPKPLGTGAVIINTLPVADNFVATTNPGLSVALGASLNLRANSTASFTTTIFGNALTLQGTGAQVTLDVNNNGANTNSFIQMGALTVGGSLNQLNVTGGNTYFVSFDPATPTALPAGGFTVNATTAGIRFPQNISTAGTLTKLGAGTLLLDGANSLGGLVIAGGVLGITNQAAVPVAFPVSNSILTLAGTGGSLANSGSPNANLINPTFLGTYGLRFDNTLGVTTNPGGRWGDTTPIVLNSQNGAQSAAVPGNDTLLLLGNPTVDVTEVVGAISFSGNARIALRPGFAGRNVTLSAPSLTRVGKGTVEFALGVTTVGLGANATQAGTLGAATNGGQFILASPPARGSNGAATVSMVTPTITNASTQSFVDYAPGSPTGFTDVAFAAGDLETAAANAIVNSGPLALTANRSAYALKLTGALTSSVGGTQRVVSIIGDQTVGNDGTAGFIPSGAFVANNPDVKLLFGTAASPREAVILAQGGNVTLGGPIVANSLTKTGDSVLLMSVDQNRSGSGATLAGLEGQITINRGTISLRTQNAAGRGGSGAFASGTTRLVLNGGTLETRLDAATTFGAGGGGAAYNITVAANSVINPDRVGTTTNATHTFGNLTFTAGADNLRVVGGNGYRILFQGNAPISLANTTTFDVPDPGNGIGGNINSGPALLTRGQLTDGPSSLGVIKTGSGKWQASAGGASMTFDGGTRVEQGSLMLEYNPATATTGAVSFGTGAITITGQGSFGFLGNATAGALTTNVDFNNTVNVVDFGGGLHLINGTASQQLRFTGQINLAAPILIGNGGGGTAGNIPQYGVLGSTVMTINQSFGGSRMMVLGGSRDMDFNGSIVDGAGGAGNGLILQNQTNNILNINGTGNTYAGGTRIIAAPNSGAAVALTGRIEVGPFAQLGTGDVVVEGGFLSLTSPSNIAPGSQVLLTPGYGATGLLVLRNLNPSQTDLQNLIDPASRNSVIALSNAGGTTYPLNLATIGDGTLFLGASLTATSYNAITLGAGAGGVYRIGGGFQTLTIPNPLNNIFNGTNSVQVGNGLYNGGLGNAAGTVVLNGSNNYSGGTVVDFGGGTFTVNGVNGLGTGALTSWSGITTITAAQSIASATILGGTVNSNALNALGSSGVVNIGAGSGLSAGPVVAFDLVEQSLNQLNLLGNATVRPNVPTDVLGAFNFSSPNAALSIAGQSVLILQGGAPTGAGATSAAVTVSAFPVGRFVNTALAVTNMNQLPATNLNLNGGVLVLDNTGLGGRLIGGTGANEIQITAAQINGLATNGAGTFNGSFFVGGGFAARGAALTIGNADLVTPGAFDTNFTLGSAALRGGLFYANAPVNLNADISVSARRVVTIAATGPGLTRAAGAANSVINMISGNLSGAGALLFRSNQNGNDGQIGEVILSGTNTMAGSPTDDFDGGGTQVFVSAGPGGMIVGTGPSNPGENGDVFVRFNGQNSLPNRASGTGPAYLMANRYGNIPNGRTGYLLTGSGAGQSYQLNANYRFVLGGAFNVPAGGTLGATSDGIAGGNASLDNSTVTLIGLVNAAGNGTILTRDGIFNLGNVAGSAGPVRFQSANVTDNGATDPGIASAASALTNSTGARTLIARGTGTAVLNRIDYRQQDTTTDSSALFTWQLGVGTLGAAEGFVRETATADATKSLSNVKTVTNGGVLEFAAPPRALTLGTAVGNIAMTGAAGGGFAANGGARSLGLNANAALTWGSTANFLAATAPLILGSPTANNTLTLTNAINLNGAPHTILQIRGTGTVPEGELSGIISGTGVASSLAFNAANSPAATPMPAGTTILSGANTYDGQTDILAGAVNIRTNTALGTTLSGTVVASGAALQLQGNLAIGDEVLALNGPGIAGTGALRSISGTSTYAGGVVFPTASTIGVDAGTLTLTGFVFGTALTKVGAGTLNIDGPENYSLLTATGGITNLATPLGTGTSAVTVAPASASGATVTFATSQTLSALVIGDLGVVTFGPAPAPSLADGVSEFAIVDLAAGDFGVAEVAGFSATPEIIGEAASTAAVPEPGSIGLLLAGLLGFVARRRR